MHASMLLILAKFTQSSIQTNVKRKRGFLHLFCTFIPENKQGGQVSAFNKRGGKGVYPGEIENAIIS
jgi:predicted restriction endonuclease